MDNDKSRQIRELYHFGTFRLDAAERRLWRDDEPISLAPKQFDLLFYFVENAGCTAKKSELLDAVWSDTYVEETTLARNVSWLRKLLEDGADGERIIETVPKLGYRFTAEVTRFDKNENALIVEERIVQHFRGEELITIDDSPAKSKIVAEIKRETETDNTNLLSPNVAASPRRSIFASLFLLVTLAFTALAGSGFILYYSNLKIVTQTAGIDIDEKSKVENLAVDAARQTVDAEIKVQPRNIIGVSANKNYQFSASEKAHIKIGSIVHLRNQSSNEVTYLDAWGLVKDKPEFSIVPTEIMFVSTHQSPNRDNGSGSWEIVSATGKKDGETLLYGDKILLRNMHPDAGYLDNCGWIKDMPIYKDFRKAEKFAVFTAYSEDRDNGTGIWIISSDTKFEGNPVLEEDNLALENGFSGGGFLDTVGRVSDIPAFNDYDGSRLVFIHEPSAGRRPDSGIWIISGSRVILK